MDGQGIVRGQRRLARGINATSWNLSYLYFGSYSVLKQVPRFSRHIALLLLLLFCRAMVPDALLLELHPHTHTVHTDQTDTKKAQVGLKHRHCQVEDVFGKPFQGSATAPLFIPLTHTTAYITPYLRNRDTSLPPVHYLRGPPLA
ncbi:hypothetical protein MKJ04_15010 [Pontibacter sp. E15-1]|uniref:hypothetical protein n=1 Tax=Pontibacter sp. E15-1 TaxID=2919918 RepID=UPI001F4FE8B3|nr:hypothetical protein [Pontibacter sp. E15-1]MCJ8166155.1 hypothetical protein [Pontibacter sp. E15-1]